MTKLLAQYNDLGTFNGIGPLGTPTNGQFAVFRFVETLSIILGFLTVLAGIWFMIQLIIGAFGWISAGGDKQHLETAKKRFSNAIIGLFLVVTSYAVAIIVASFFGIDLLNLGATIGLLAPV